MEIVGPEVDDLEVVVVLGRRRQHTDQDDALELVDRRREHEINEVCPGEVLDGAPVLLERDRDRLLLLDRLLERLLLLEREFERDLERPDREPERDRDPVLALRFLGEPLPLRLRLPLLERDRDRLLLRLLERDRERDPEE